jgi:hypothetical protein
MLDADAALLELLAPKNQPDPCTAPSLANDNHAYGRPVRASASLPAEPPALAVDDDSATQWGAGAAPVQWIEVELGALHRITAIRLLVAQWPEGETIHRVQVRRDATEAYRTVHEFRGVTRDGEWLVLEPQTPLENVGQIRIQTVQSPSWVAWKEIQAFGEPIPP